MFPTSTLSCPVFSLVLPQLVCPCRKSKGLSPQTLLQDLMADLKSELSGSLAKLILGLMLTPAQYDAKQLRKAVEVTATLVVSALAREDEAVFAVVVPTPLVARAVSTPQLHVPPGSHLLYGRKAEQKAPGQRPGLHSRPTGSPVWPLCNPARSSQPIHKASQGGLLLLYRASPLCSGSSDLPGAGSHRRARVGANQWCAPLSTSHTGWDPTSSTLGHFRVLPALGAICWTWTFGMWQSWG